jgi:hypothetical protein
MSAVSAIVMRWPPRNIYRAEDGSVLVCAVSDDQWHRITGRIAGWLSVEPSHDPDGIGRHVDGSRSAGGTPPFGA